MRRIAIGILILFSLGACKHKAEKATLLRLKYQKGNTFDITYQKYAETQDKRLPRNEVVKMVFRVDSVIGDTLFVLSSKIGYLRVKNEGLFESEEYISDRPEKEMSLREKQLHSQFKPVLELIYTLTINNRGKVVKPLSLADGQVIDRKYAPVDYENCQIVFPEQAVGIGDEWTNELDIPGTKGRRVCNYTIESIKDDEIRIGLSGEFEPDGKWGKSADFYGHYLIDEETKRVISAVYKMEDDTFLKGKGTVGVVVKSRNAVFFPK